jgi:hypothetical protein
MSPAADTGMMGSLLLATDSKACLPSYSLEELMDFDF